MSEDTDYDEFTCAMCKGKFNKGRSDEDAADEAEVLFGTRDTSEMDVVCDDCWKKMGFREGAPAPSVADTAEAVLLDALEKHLLEVLKEAEAKSYIRRIEGSSLAN